MATITYFPVITEKTQLIDLLSRAAWFLTFCPMDRIYVPVASEHLKEIPWRVAEGMDESIAKNFEKLRTRVVFVLAGKESDLHPCMSEASIILRWKKDSCPGFVAGATLGGWLKGKKVWEVDPAAVRMEGSFYIEAGLHLTPNKTTVIKENQAKFDRLVVKLGRFKRAYLMATGPSISHYKKYEFQDSLNIVCNSVILDEELMRVVNPQILVFADPIFHFGPSQYAGAFRKSLIESARRHDFVICMPFKYYGLFISAVPELVDRTIGIPFTKDREFNFSLDKDFNLKTTANILTFTMIPLAGTFAKEIGFLGCDGRPLEENTYFWGHNEKTQINDKMANIREVHPGFFAIDYNDYYLEHCNTLGVQLQEGEKRGLKFFSLAFSHIPALKSRLSRAWHSNSISVDFMPQRAIIIDPDAKDFSGHFMAYNNNIESALLLRKLSAVLVLCNKDMDGDLLRSHKNYLPKLSINTWSLVWKNVKEVTCQRARREIIDALESVLDDDIPAIVYMYAGSVEYVDILSECTRRFPQLYVNVNLFWFSFRDLKDDKEYVEKWRPLMEWLDVAGPRFVASVPTHELQQEIAQIFGVVLDVAPHPSTGVPDSMLSALGHGTIKGRDQSVRVLLPGGVREEKGYYAAIEFARMLGSDLSIQTILRYAPTSSSPGELRTLPKDLPQNVRVVTGVLSNDEFRRMFEEADIVVLPYTPEAFKNRTSGLLIDALAHGVPAVVVEGTWLANEVKRHGNGVVVADETAVSLVAGVRQIALDIQGFRAKTCEAAKTYFAHNSWEALAGYILKPFEIRPKFPRVVGIDLTPIGGVTATGRVKEVFFRGWPKKDIHWINIDRDTEQLCSTALNECITQRGVSEEKLLEGIHQFDPDVIYYRAVENDLVHAFATKAISSCNKPYAIHLMDDWPQRLAVTEPSRFAGIDASLRELIDNANACLSIGESMSSAFGRRYGTSFREFANAIDPASFPPRKRVPKKGDEFVICYAGALADDMTLASVMEVASAVESLPRELNVRLHIHTRPPWTGVANRAFSGMQAIRIKEQVAASDYCSLLQESDALLIAYNFDQRSRDYIGYSIANKMPECMASGTPVIAYGPSDVATIAYLKSWQAALVVDQPGKLGVYEAIQALVASRPKQLELGQKAREVAFRRHNLWSIAGRFRSLLNDCKMQGGLKGNKPLELVGPYNRTSSAHWDETEGVAMLFGSCLNGITMIDVGGHHGSALMPFLNKGWRIFAFEPDEKNRTKLLERLDKHKNKALVTLDTRCVSNKSQKGLSFYRSEQSTGISGLSAFHESHVEAQRVDTITLTEFFEGKPLPTVDFLKIDTEGHDLFVLQGFLWDRTQPAVIECEFEDTKTVPLGYTFHDLAGFLVDKGYTVYVSEWHPIIRYGIRHDWNRLVRYPCELADKNGWGNLLAFLDPIDEKNLVAAVRKVLKVGAGETAKPAAVPTSKTIVTVAPAVGTKPATVFSAQPGGSAYKVVPGKNFKELSSNQWRYTHSDAAQKLWEALFDVAGSTVNRSFVACTRLKSNRTMKVSISIGRYGNSEYEGAHKYVTLTPGMAQTVQVRKEFTMSHAVLKVQVEVLQLEGGGTADLTIESVSVNETLGSIRRWIPKCDQNLSVANQLYREGDYSTSMGLYLLLHQQRPLKMYPDNALMAARKLGIDSVRTVEELLQLVQ